MALNKLVALITILFSISIPKTTLANSDWNQLVTKVIESGKRVEILPGEEVRYLEKIVPNNPNESRTADYFSVRGIIVNGVNFRSLEITGVGETWIREENQWKIYQWLFQVNKETGNLISASYRLIQKSVDGGSVKITPLDSGDENWQQTIWEQHRKKFAHQ
jgi:hypothetical protein